MPGSGRPDVTGRSARLWLFFVVVFGSTWSFWIFAAAFEIGVRTTTGQTLLRVGLFGPMLGPIHHPCNGIRRHRRSRSLRHCDGSHRAARRSGVSSRCQLCDAPPSLGRPPKQDDGQPPTQRLSRLVGRITLPGNDFRRRKSFIDLSATGDAVAA